MLASVQRLAAFSLPDRGGNPAGVVLLDHPAEAAAMQATAAAVGYSETAFLWPHPGGWTVRYWSPRIEVPFCGHATVAAAAWLGQRFGAGRFALETSVGPVQARAWRDGAHWRAGFDSRPTQSGPLQGERLLALLAVFGLVPGDLDPGLPPAEMQAGARHALLALRSRERLRALSYPFEALAQLQRDAGWTTVSVVVRDADGVFHARNPFAVGGVVEDPATGAAAAALAGHLRDHGRWGGGTLVIRQGEDMGQPCLLQVQADATPHAGVNVSGLVRALPRPAPLTPETVAAAMAGR